MLFGVELKPGSEFAHTFTNDTKVTAAVLAIKKGASPPKAPILLQVRRVRSLSRRVGTLQDFPRGLLLAMCRCA